MRIKRQLDDPRALRDTASGAVIFAFGVAGPEPHALPGPAIVTLLGALGMTEATVRATILRMRRGGWLTAARKGPVVEYALTAPARALAVSVMAPVIGRRPAWDGAFHGLLFSVPETGRGYRDALRRAAIIAGFGQLRPGLLVATDVRRWSRIESLLGQAPVGSRLLRVELHLAPDDARAAAAEAWPLDDLARTYRHHAAELQRVADRLRHAPPTGPEAARVMWEAMTPVSIAAIDDPMLPAELLPLDWPGPDLKAGVEAVGMVVGVELQAYIAELTGSSRPVRP
jgi:phenylacetic acid degradation operon negative regulatory protein